MLESISNQNKPSAKIKPLGLPPRFALVLGAGGVKGAAHIGILEVLHQAGIIPDLIVGCSVGSIIGALYADRKDTSNLYDFARQVVPKRSYSYKAFGLPYLRKGISGQGFFSTARARQILTTELQAKTFEELQIPLNIVATELNTGMLKTFSSGSLIPPICASSAIPGIFQPVVIQTNSYVDGGVITDLPVSVAKKTGAPVVIAVVLRSKFKIGHGGTVHNLVTHAYTISKSHSEKHQEEMADLILQPDIEGNVGLVATDDKTFRLMYELGKRKAEEKLPQIKELLANAAPKQMPSTT